MVNKVILIGNLGADAEIREFDGGSRKASFSLATSDSYKDKLGNWVDQTDWHNIEVWNPSDHLVANLFKGTKLFVEGKLKCNSYDDSAGNKRHFYYIKSSMVRVLSSSGSTSDTPSNNETHPGMTGGFDGIGNDDLPF